MKIPGLFHSVIYVFRYSRLGHGERLLSTVDTIVLNASIEHWKWDLSFLWKAVLAPAFVLVTRELIKRWFSVNFNFWELSERGSFERHFDERYMGYIFVNDETCENHVFMGKQFLWEPNYVVEKTFIILWSLGLRYSIYKYRKYFYLVMLSQIYAFI